MTPPTGRRSSSPASSPEASALFGRKSKRDQSQGEDHKVLPLDALVPEQKKDWKKTGGFNVRGSDGYIYRIVKTQRVNNVIGPPGIQLKYPPGFGGHMIVPDYNWLGCNPVDETGRVPGTDLGLLCPMTRFIAQKVWLECDAPAFVNSSCSTISCALEHDQFRLMMGSYNGKI